MPQSLDYVLLHLIFSTKDRVPCLDAEIRPRLYAYMAGVAREAGYECPRIGGMADHVHVALRLPRTMAIAAIVEEVKTTTSKWLKIEYPRLGSFAWQRGYAVFSVGPADQAALVQYIDNQEEHHRTKTFREEYLAFLKKYGVTFDERYMWD